MNKLQILSAVLIMAALLVCSPSFQASAAPTATITLLNPPAGGVLELDVGESYTFDVEIMSDEPFVLAMATIDQYYPGRSIFTSGGDRTTHRTTALLHITVTGKAPTVDLPGGVAPIAIVAGVRYKGGLVISERFDFAISVP